MIENNKKLCDKCSLILKEKIDLLIDTMYDIISVEKTQLILLSLRWRIFEKNKENKNV